MDEDEFEPLVYSDDLWESFGDAEREREREAAQRAKLAAEAAAKEATASTAVADDSRDEAGAASSSRGTSSSALDPINWYHNIPTTSGNAIAKRRREVEDLAAASTAKRIKEATLSRKAAEVVVPAIYRRKKWALDYPPLSGEDWLGVSCPNNFQRKYFILEKRDDSVRAPVVTQFTNQEVIDMIGRLMRDYIPPHLRTLDEVHVLPPNSPRVLWSDKYSHPTFLELVSDNNDNHLVMSWLMAWKPMYHKAADCIPISQIPSAIELEREAPQVPKKKVMLIYGPPGIGKTALAEAVSKRDFEPFHINMSDVHNASDFKRVFTHAMTYHSICFNTKTRLPRCLVVDGLEFASSDVINAFCKWIKSYKKGSVVRPVICTCVNPFIQTLREFRQLVFMVKLRSNNYHMIERVKQIFEAESIDVSSSTLKTVVEQCRGDARLCLNTLQFHAMAHGAEDKENYVVSSAELSVFDAIEHVVFLNSYTDGRGFLKESSKRLDAVYDLACARSDFERFHQLVYFNLLEMSKLPAKKLVQVTKSYVDCDELGTLGFTFQDFRLFKYRWYSLVRTHLVAGIMNNRKHKLNLAVPNVTEARRHVASVLVPMRLSKANCSLHCGLDRLVMDVLAMLVYILQPPIPVSGPIMLPGVNIDVVKHIAAIMIKFGISIVLKSDSPDYTFEPPITDLAVYRLHGYSAPELPKPAKHFIVRELELQTYGAGLNADGSPSEEKSVGRLAHAPIVKEPFVFRFSNASTQIIKRTVSINSVFGIQ